MFYAAYGSNLHPGRLVKRIPLVKFKKTVQLSGWALRFHKLGQDGSGKCNIVQTKDSNQTVHIALYEMNETCKYKLDEIEGLGNGYEERWLNFDNFGEAFVYVATPRAIDESLHPYTWYKELVLHGCQYHKFPQNYIDTIKQIPTREDEDRDRQIQNQNLMLSLSI